jgi:hypothetical protein
VIPALISSLLVSGRKELFPKAWNSRHRGEQFLKPLDGLHLLKTIDGALKHTRTLEAQVIFHSIPDLAFPSMASPTAARAKGTGEAEEVRERITLSVAR